MEVGASLGRRWGKGAGVVLILLGGYLFVGGLVQKGFVLQPMDFSSSGRDFRSMEVRGGGHPIFASVEEARQTERWERRPEYLLDPSKLAKKYDKNVFLMFSAKWCTYCRTMKREVFSDMEVAEYIYRHFIPVYFDVDRVVKVGGREVSLAKVKNERYGMAALPGFIFYDRSGREVARGEKMGKEEFLALLKKVVSQNQKK
ncbi:MAG: DUF255 domain-containing protein [Planctomycetota bacterium]|nr:MAG: DUF255 domain-containing protein [Planctomycetota bacterium]